jgi:hypothetical protein
MMRGYDVQYKNIYPLFLCVIIDIETKTKQWREPLKGVYAEVYKRLNRRARYSINGEVNFISKVEKRG